MPGRVGRTVAAALVVAAPALEVAPPKKDLAGNELTKLYNSKIVSQQPMQRDLNIPYPGGKELSKPLGKVGARHEGMKVTTESGGEFLVHKGPGHGTVVTDVSNMGPGWSKFGDSKDLSNSNVKLGDMVKAGGSKFNTAHSNCQHAVKDMQRVSNPHFRSAWEHAVDDFSGVNRVEHLGPDCGSFGGTGPRITGGGGGVRVEIPIPCSIL